jgi:hypothetical protein
MYSTMLQSFKDLSPHLLAKTLEKYPVIYQPAKEIDYTNPEDDKVKMLIK